MSKNTIDHALAEKVLLQIEMHPENFGMAEWVEFGEDEAGDDERYEQILDVEQEMSCGTTLCVAGWVELLTEGKINTTGIEQRAKDKLGLETDGLFYVSDLRAKRVLEHMVDPTSTPKSVTNLIYTDYL